MPTIIDLDETRLSEVLAVGAGPAPQDTGAVWRVQATPRTVHRLEHIHRLADRAGAQVRFVASADLDEQERAFFDDYVRYRLPIPAMRRLGDKAAEWLGAGCEVFNAAIRYRPGPAGTAGEPPAKFDSAVIIGVYGGDHIGDGAILGGVLLDLHRRHGVTSATIMSARPAHTRRLVEGLSVPVRVEVDAYRAARVERRLDGAQALVLGGGPLFNSPRILSRHLAAVEAARRRGLPFLVERIGIGPLGNPVCKWAARRILAAASRISVRSAVSARHPLLAGLKPELARDPAFDYLATRRELDRLPARDRAAADALLADAGEAVTIGINLRSTHDDWFHLTDFGDRVVDAAFMAKMAEALTRFARAGRRRVTYVFFPMNAIQLGMSDLSAAYELRAMLPDDIELRVWEGDPSLDGVLYLLRRLDAVVAMRFHAAVFALSQGTRLVGVDYFPPPGGKVSQLLDDGGHPQDAVTVEAFTSDWLVERLHAKLDDAPRQGVSAPADEAGRG